MSKSSSGLLPPCPAGHIIAEGNIMCEAHIICPARGKHHCKKSIAVATLFLLVGVGRFELPA